MVKHRKNHGLLYMLVIFGAERPGLIWVFTNGKPVDVPLRKHGLNADGLQRWSTTASSFGQWGAHPFLVLNLSCLLKIDPTRHIAEGLWNQVEPVSMGAATLIQVTLAFLQKIHLKHLRPSQITYGTWSFWRLSHWKKCQLQDMSDMTADICGSATYSLCLGPALTATSWWSGFPLWTGSCIGMYEKTYCYGFTERTERTTPYVWGDEPFPQLLFQFLLNKRINHAEMTSPFPKEFSVPIDRNPPPKKNSEKCKAPK